MSRPLRSSPKIFQRARELRKETTPAEKKLWAHLRPLRENGIRIRRQHAIGRYIADFYLPKTRLIIELDGSQHLEQKENDLARTSHLESKGYRVIRFWNNEVMNNIESVILAINHALEQKN